LYQPLRCYILDFGGGLVSGDVIRLQFHIKSGASATITSQSTTKAFKSIEGRPHTYLRTEVRIEDSALLALVPQPIQCYNQSKLRQETILTMARSSTNVASPSTLLVDWYTGGGRSLDHGNWNFHSFHTCTELKWLTTDNGKTYTCFKDQSVLTGGNELRRHMRSFNVVCLVLLVGPRVANVAAKLLKDFSSRSHYESYASNQQQWHHRGGPSSGSSSNGYNHDSIGLNHVGEKLLVSCGSFPLLVETANEEETGVILRIAAGSIEQAANLLSRYIGDLDGQLEDDPFMDILTTHQVLNTSQPILQTNGITSSELSCGLLRLPSQSDVEMPMEVDLVGTTNSNPCTVPPMCLHQLVDSSSPTGGFAHSNTLEAAFQLHFINDHYSLLDHAWDVLLQTTTTMVPFLVKSCHLFQKPAGISWDMQIDAWDTVDRDLSITLTSQVTRRASCVQGSGILRTYGGVYSHIRNQVESLRSRINGTSSSSGNRGHAATCFGAVCGLLGVSPYHAANMFLYTVTRDIVNAGVRMNLIGPIEGGHLIHLLCAKISAVLDEIFRCIEIGAKHLHSEILEPHAAHQVAPLLEILANAHDRLYSRLFNS
jgi:urease accessory protein UreF/urease accessory protein UreH